MFHTEPVSPFPYELPGDPMGPADRDTLDSDAILRFVRRFWKLCLIWLCAGLFIGITCAALSPPRYTALASMLFETGSLTAPGATDSTNTTFIDTQVQVLESDEVIGRVVDAEKLVDSREFGPRKDSLRALGIRYARLLLGYPPAPYREPRHATIMRVRRALSVSRLGMSNVVQIVFTSRNPDRAAKIANAMVRSYVDGRRAQEQEVRKDRAAELRKRLLELQTKAFPVEMPHQADALTPAGEQAARAHFHATQEQTASYRALYHTVLQQAYENLNGSSPSFSVRVINPAEPPLAPVLPVLLLGGFGVFGAVAGIGHALCRAMTDDRLHEPDDLRRLTGFDRIIGIPKVEIMPGTGNEATPGYVQQAYLQVSPVLYEAVAKLAVALQDAQSRRGSWIVGVAAPSDGTGASSVAGHLARLLAESGQRTLLVDANWRKPCAGQAFLSSSQSRRLARAQATINVEAEKFDVLALRTTVPVSELNASLSIVSTLEPLRTDYDCIVVDLPSSAQMAGLQAVVGIVNEVIMVAEAHRTTSETVRGALRALPRTKVAALVLNKV